ncbi:TetR/AcrR family transcriptional regulator [Bacteroidota bacterium]
MPRTKDQYKEIRDERKNQIAQVALALFAERSYQSVTISEIAQKASISKGLLYNYFQGKDDLLKYIILDELQHMVMEIDPNHDGVVEKHELLNFIDHTFDMFRQNIQFWKFYMIVITQTVVFKIVQEEVNAIMKPFISLMHDYFENAGFENPMLEVNILSSLIDGAMFHYILNPDIFQLEHVKERIKDMYK